MPKRYLPSDLLRQAQAVLTAWNAISDTLTFGDLNAASLRQDLASASALREEMALAESTLIDLRNRRDALHTALWDKVKRVRSGVKGTYGDDSSQYEMVGGTRLSERKKAARRSRDPMLPRPETEA